MKKLILVAVVALLAASVPHTTAARGKKGQRYDVYLLIGQSNMAGRGRMIASDTTQILDGVWLLNDRGEIEPARSPLNRYSTIRKRLSLQQVGPGEGFSQELHRRTGRKILLVVNARGGSALEEWTKGRGNSFYEDAVRRAREAMRYGRLKAIIWHQGESNGSRSATYLDQLAGFVADLRADLGDVPFIAGEIARWNKNAEAFNGVIAGIADRIPDSDYVSSEDCTPLIDASDPHFSRDGQLLLGRRYAEKILKRVYGKTIR